MRFQPIHHWINIALWSHNFTFSYFSLNFVEKWLYSEWHRGTFHGHGRLSTSFMNFWQWSLGTWQLLRSDLSWAFFPDWDKLDLTLNIFGLWSQNFTFEYILFRLNLQSPRFAENYDLIVILYHTALERKICWQ